ncbi:hypothetical protein Dacet_2186 [Denitrovibrio acetiphilus DSM 12809]|uniref:Uncharacterized protein n=1 Tax=Denitrovibrio acetiphilus (strain DSM 12809 / NBRC 114555 / N2460) TaxID=522772 RepID=D4H2F7_DENA2|nr:hypothetical protein [Denitrovibrio acetiphilus]ADD68948.1 hypothetical protein Dacet_2186 [Denitrovibrio acetiphilus DSM 12809]
MPVQVYVQNKSDDTYLLSPEGINLFNETGGRVPALSLDQTYNKLKKSYWRSGGWAVATGGFAGFSIHNVLKINEQIKADIANRMFKGGNLVPGSATEGTIFLDVTPRIASINNWSLTVVIRNGKTGELVSIPYSLSGNIIVRDLLENVNNIEDE